MNDEQHDAHEARASEEFFDRLQKREHVSLTFLQEDAYYDEQMTLTATYDDPLKIDVLHEEAHVF